MTEKKKAGLNQTDELLRLARKHAKFWLARDKTPYATFPIGGLVGTENEVVRYEHLPIEHHEFQDWLVGVYELEHKRAPSNESALKTVKMNLKARVRNEAARDPSLVKDYWMRIGPGKDDEEFLLYTGDNRGQTIVITKDNLRYERNPNWKFIHYPGIEALPEYKEPIPGDPLRDGNLKRWIRVSDENLMLIEGFILTSWRFAPEFYLQVLKGQSGAAKTSAGEMILSLIDPNADGLVKEPDTSQELIVNANSRHLVAYDNVDSFKPHISNDLARLCTGASITQKLLYTNFGVARTRLNRPVLVTGIGDFIKRQDVIRRALIVELPKHNASKRKKKLLQEWAIAKPYIFGSLLKKFQKGLRDFHLYEDREDLQEMAETTSFACAALGENFLKAYLTMTREEGAFIAIEASPIANEWIRWVDETGKTNSKGRKYIKSSASEARKALAYRTDGARPFGFPETDSAFGKAADRIAPALQLLGHDLEKGRAGGVRWLKLTLDKGYKKPELVEDAEEDLEIIFSQVFAGSSNPSYKSEAA